ncbi:site-specific recombinase [Roseateles sp. BYS87W]|uniref:Site-specific recombinase n=1 Tax=Pelomonas baiyunensis TaxID=3299026 RepID=A0ABW7GZJ1_9BURK
MTNRHWDLTALLNAADPQAALAERNLWLVRLLEWLRHAPPASLAGKETRDDSTAATPQPLVRLKHLLNVLERHPEHARAFAEVIGGVWNEVDAVALFAEVGFAPRMALWHEAFHRVRRRLLPATTDTRDLAELFELLFGSAADEDWIAAIDDALLARLSLLFAATPDDGWRVEARAAITVLISQVHAAGLGSAMRVRMDPTLLQDQPFHQLPAAWAAVERALADGAAAGAPATAYLHALLDRCRAAAQTVPEHLEAHGVSVDLMFSVEQLTARLDRIDALLACLLSPQPPRELLRLVAGLVRGVHERRSLRTLFGRHYSLLARKVAERSAETGEHYITRNPGEYRDMLRRAAGGGAVIAGTTLLKFSIAWLGFTAFWGGFWAGMNYAASFVLIHLLHWTVATKQPAMTAPAMAAKLQHIDREDGVEGFVDEVTHLVRSQVAGIVGNLALAAPLVLLVQGLCWWTLGAPWVGEKEAHYVLHSLSLAGPSLLFAAFTGTLLFASSLIAGWVENGFVLHRLDSAIAWNPRIVAMLGRTRAAAWSRWWRANISGLTANISLGLMLGLVPALSSFFGLGLEVRHVTLSTGQLAAAVGALGVGVMATWAFWSCVLCIAGIGVLNVGVSFFCAFRVAMRSRGIRLADRRRVYAAIRARLRREPLSFLVPPK